MQPDYSRQLMLKEIGPQGQAALGAARVLVVGAGGLGSPVLQYLAGAGIGTLGIIDGDVLEASNLHRQPIFASDEVGAPKARLAAAAVRRLNPSINVQIHEERLDADNACALLRDYDLVVDCSDNFRAKYLINDAAVLTHRPAVFASVYQYEGQLQVYKPEPMHACLRCLWPEGSTDGVVGNCAEAGVLGPVPGTFGALQALLTIKVIAQLPGQLAGELLLLDLTNFSSTRLKAPRRPECTAPGCSHIHSIAREQADIELNIESLAQARRQGYTVIDIRSAAEIAEHPSGALHIAMEHVLTQATPLPEGPIALLCASGKRSLAAARELRTRGIEARSIAGGLEAVRD